MPAERVELTEAGAAVLVEARRRRQCPDCERVQVFVAERVEPVADRLVKPCPAHVDESWWEVWLRPVVRVDAWGVAWVDEGVRPPQWWLDWRGLGGR